MSVQLTTPPNAGESGNLPDSPAFGGTINCTDCSPICLGPRFFLWSAPPFCVVGITWPQARKANFEPHMDLAEDTTLHWLI